MTLGKYQAKCRRVSRNGRFCKMREIPTLDLSTVEDNPDLWEPFYRGWIENARVVFTDRYLRFEDSNQETRSFNVLPPLPSSQVPTFRNFTIRTNNREIVARINCHTLYISAFLVDGQWYVFRGAFVGDIFPQISIDTDDSYTELVPRTKQSPNAPTPTRESIGLGRYALIGAVNDIAGEWSINNHGIARISSNQARGSVVIFQMISEAIRFLQVLDILSCLGESSTNAIVHAAIWEHQNEWAKIGRRIHVGIIENNVEDLMTHHAIACVIKSDDPSLQSTSSSPASSSRSTKKGGHSLERGESSKSRDGRNRRGGGSTRLRRYMAAFFCLPI